MNIKAQEWLERAGSVQLTLFCLALSMVLIIFGTLAQVELGTFAAQREYFNSWFLYGWFGDNRVPVFPGGLTVGALWMINLLAAFAVRFQFKKDDAGVLLSHFGLIVLLFGQFLTQTLARESQMPIEVGLTAHYSEFFRDTEIAVINTSPADHDEVTAIPFSIFSRKERIPLPGKPFTLVMKRVYRNSQLGMGAASSVATQGMGTRIAVQEIPPVSLDEETNTVSAYVGVLDGEKDLGTWLLSTGLGAPQGFTSGGQEYRLVLRPRRQYYPFSMTLKEFRHDRYPGTDIPKNFSSLVHLKHPAKNESRDALIYMNHPLRYEGNTFYQASFGKGDRLSIFQVVRNPAWLTPYISCSIVVLGLCIQFGKHLRRFIRKRA